ncbi:hypothetical protein B0I37DRAFT_434852 [Chaetomium sp. MPI-CAGE-AT-0009]|nr:hypothetical protein B0I37DRAFT_434852 [Chaetomium sp. MPI-CAGE-AT-0009]
MQSNRDASSLLAAYGTTGWHFTVLPRCGTCDTPIATNDDAVALLGDRSDTHYISHTEQFSFPNLHRDFCTVGHHHFCCEFERCGWRGLAVPVHADCFDLLHHNWPLEVNNALRRVWSMRAWSLPLFGAGPLDVEHPPVMSRHVLERVAIAMRFPQLLLLPGELLEMIRVNDPCSWLWRAVATLTLAHDLPNMPDATTQNTLLLGKIACWDREAGLTLVNPGGNLTYGNLMRITFDAHGIKKLERVHEFGPSPRGPARDDAAYILAPVSALHDLRLSDKDGRLRIEWPLPSPSSPLSWHLQMWNTPSPASGNTPYVALARNDREVPVITRTFELATITGITLLYRRKAFFVVHVHDAKHPTALAAYKRLPANCRETTWQYLPVNQATDPILAMGFREDDLPTTADNTTTPGRSIQLLVRQRLSGDTHLGDWRRPTATATTLHPPPSRAIVQVQAHPTTFTHGVPRAGQPISFLGATRHPPTPADAPHHYPSNSDRGGPPFAPTAQPPRKRSPGAAAAAAFTDAHRRGVYSVAPLHGVARVDVYRADDEQRELAGYDFKGAVFYYEGGARRAVGHVRVGVDEVWRVARPVGVVVRKAVVLGMWVVGVEFLVEGFTLCCCREDGAGIGGGDGGVAVAGVEGGETGEGETVEGAGGEGKESKRTYAMAGEFRCWCGWPHVTVEIAGEGEEEEVEEGHEQGLSDEEEEEEDWEYSEDEEE